MPPGHVPTPSPFTLLHFRPGMPYYSGMSEKPTPEEIESLRAAAAARAQATSLRGAAKEIGMSASGLMKFLAGAQPYGPTVRRLLAWHGDDDAQRERDQVIARFLGLLPAQRRASAETMLRALVAGPVRERRALDAALGDLGTGKDRTRIARGLSRLADRTRDPAPLTRAEMDRDATRMLAALVELLDTALPRDAMLSLDQQPVRKRALLAALREYLNRPE